MRRKVEIAISFEDIAKKKTIEDLRKEYLKLKIKLFHKKVLG